MQQTDALRAQSAGQTQLIVHGVTGLAVGRKGAASQCVAVFGVSPAEGDVVFQVEEVEAVAHMECQRLVVGGEDAVGHGGLGVVVLQLVVVGQRRAVGVEQSVGAIVAVHLEARRVRREDPLLVAKSGVLHARVCIPERYALVGPLPHRAAGYAGRALYDFPLAVVVFKRDAQRVAIFGEDDGTVQVLVETAYLRGRGIVGRVDGCRRREGVTVSRALLLPETAEVAAYLREAVGARGVEPGHVVAHLDAGLRQRVLVAHTPNQHRGVVLVAPHGGAGALHQQGLVAAATEVFVAVAEGHLRDQVEAQRVGQIVEAGLAGIVGETHVVDRGLLHHAHIAQRQCVANDLHRARVGGVGVDAAQLDGASVQIEHVAVDGQLAQPHPLLYGLQRLGTPLQSDAQRI